MRDLIEALTILMKYADKRNPTNCFHDVLCVCWIKKGTVSDSDVKRLDELGFFWSDEYDCWASFRFGSC